MGFSTFYSIFSSKVYCKENCATTDPLFTASSDQRRSVLNSSAKWKHLHNFCFLSGKSLICSIMSNVCSEGGRSKGVHVMLSRWLLIFVVVWSTAWLAHRKSWVSCAEKYSSFSYSEAIEKFAFGGNFFPKSDKLWQGGREESEWAVMEAVSQLTPVGVLNSCEPVLWGILTFPSAFILLTNGERCLRKG